MRKVRPEDEIPVEFLEENHTRRRLAKFNNHKFSYDVEQAMKDLQAYMEDSKRKSSLEFMERIYQTVDLYMNEIMPYTVCRTGCAHCCNGIPVEITLVEAAYINEKTGREINKKAKELFRAAKAASGPCTFLDTDKAICTIYEYRPLSCRLFAALDHPDLCIGAEVEHKYHGFQSNKFWGWIGECLFHASAANVGNKKKRHQPISEIRSYFK